MKVLVACEFSGVVRRAFRAAGHDAWSCDLLPAADGSEFHWCGDVLELLENMRSDREFWPPPALMIAHPPCTYLANSSAWAFKDGPYHQRVKPGTLVGAARRQARADAFDFFMALWNAPVRRVAIENPVGVLSSLFRKPDQIVQPWQFGDDASKGTCFWLRGLPPLRATDELPGGRTARRGNQTASGQNRLPPSPDRWKKRSETYPGIAAAMARQWGASL